MFEFIMNNWILIFMVGALFIFVVILTMLFLIGASKMNKEYDEKNHERE